MHVDRQSALAGQYLRASLGPLRRLLGRLNDHFIRGRGAPLNDQRHAAINHGRRSIVPRYELHAVDGSRYPLTVDLMASAPLF